MNSGTIISIIAIYFLALYIISYQTSKDDSNNGAYITYAHHIMFSRTSALLEYQPFQTNPIQTQGSSF